MRQALAVKFDSRKGPNAYEIPHLAPRKKGDTWMKEEELAKLPEQPSKWDWTEDPVKKLHNIEMKARVRQEFDRWQKSHPKDATEIDKVMEKINSLTGVVMPIRSVGKKLFSFGSAHTPVIGTGTSYGYRGDATGDRNSSAGIGAFVPADEQKKIRAGKPSDYRLREGDIAVSPDIQAEFEAAGVKPMGEVMLKMANGQSRRVRWADTTASDALIAAGKVKGVTKPLRGRFDFYSPTGKHPLDGMKVLSWEPAK